MLFALPHYTAVDDAEALIETLLPDEKHPLSRYALRRKITYAGGRFAMRRVLGALGVDASQPIAFDERGAPVLPSQVRGSISHKDDIVGALATFDVGGFVGIDVEGVPGPSDELASRILTPRELEHVRTLSDAARALELSLRFSAKEAIYKALDPYVRRYVAHDEVETWPENDGSMRVWSEVFPTNTRVEVLWRRHGANVVTTARIGT